MPNPNRRRKLRWVLLAVTGVVIVVGVIVAILVVHSPGNVSHPSLSFTQPTTTAAPPRKPKRRVVNNFRWALYGYDLGRTRYFNAPASLAPPLRVGWSYNDFALLEFPPVIYGNSMFFLDDNGWAKALDTRNGHQLWARRVGTLAAASPAISVSDRRVIMPLLSVSGHSPGNGRVVALSMRNGHVLWSRPIPAGSETSPVVWGRSVYLGDQSGTIYSLRTRDGHLNWTYHASAAVKGGPALSGGVLYFGDYAGRAYAVRASNGSQVWAVATNGAHFGFGSGNFYSTPAVAFGRVYMGNTDGRVYSFAMRTGELAWATGTGAYVYASAAVADIRGLGPTVYLGSYDGNFYAFDAQSGAIRWSHPSGGKISGAATIVGNVVYYSDLGTKTTLGLDARTGRTVFRFPDGAFNPVIADYGAIYLDGYGAINQLVRRGPRHAARATRVRRGRHRAGHSRHRSVHRRRPVRPGRRKHR
jgi:outer membrane protein assembly factor BamB